MSTPRASIRVPRGIPASVVHVAVAAVSVTLAISLVPVTFWAIVAIALGITAAAAPRLYTAWAFNGLLALMQLTRDVSAADWQPYVLLAGLHLMHVLASLALVVPLRGMIDARAFTRVLRRFVIVQLPCQALLAGVLVVTASEAFTIAIPALAPIGAVALIVLAAVFVVPLVRRGARSAPVSHR